MTRGDLGNRDGDLPQAWEARKAFLQGKKAEADAKAERSTFEAVLGDLQAVQTD